ALDAQSGQSSFHKRCHDQDPPNNREGENKKKHRKDIGEPSSRSSRRNRSPVVIVQDDTPAMQPQKQVDILIQKHSKPEWFPKKVKIGSKENDKMRSDDQEYEFSYANVPRLSVNDIEDMYLLQVQDKLHHLPLEFMKEFNNALLMFIRRTVIKNRLSEVKKFYDGTLVKIQENLIDMLSKNKLGSGNKRLKGKD
ncbi:hypothetical protein Tco_1386480, partial [Tanacetum coccineum]